MEHNNQVLTTARLLIRPINEGDASFILELVNTEGWLKYIGNRKVNNELDALNYIRKIVSDQNITYRVVQLDRTSIGIITLIKREHLPFSDIGFAFLPNFQGKGYAYEASNAVLESIIETSDHQTILATTIPKNQSSIRLIEKLGLSFYNTEEKNGETSALYKLNVDKLKIDQLIKKFFNAFTNKDLKPRLNLISETCLEETIITKNTKGIAEIYNLQSFISPREELLTNGTLLDFKEFETEEKTVISGSIAQRFSQYQKVGIMNNEKFSAKGNKMFQMTKIKTQWKICSIIWEDE